MTPEGVIGVDGALPWHYPADMRRFRRLTTGGTVIMGRRTWESLGGRPLPGRRNLVVTRAELTGVECFRDLEAALAAAEGPVWFIGGTELYLAALPYCDFVDVTIVPAQVVEGGEVVRFPPLDEAAWRAGPAPAPSDDPRLRHVRYTRRDSSPDGPS